MNLLKTTTATQNELFVQFWDIAYNFIKNKYGRAFNEENYADAYQDASIEITIFIDSGELNQSELIAKFCTICLRRYIDIYRKEAKYIKLKSAVPASTSSNAQDHTFEKKEAARKIWKYYEQIIGTKATLLLKHSKSGFSYKEIAQELDYSSANTAKKEASKYRLRLRMYFHQNPEELKYITDLTNLLNK